MAISRSYDVGDTVYVWYNEDNDLQFTPQSRDIAEVCITNATGDALIKFTSGNSVTDLISTPRVFTTQAACATAIINQVITDTAATVVLEGGANTTLVRTT